ncbi:MAG: DNA polymerase III subunit alpha, partial [Prevotellaceae bacterium]|nr:DNA polymerase III subunit alpha [Prevotellaceae bacterium]
KSSIKDVARVQKLPLSESDRLSKLVPDKFPEEKDGKAPKVNLTNCYKLVDDFKRELNSGDSNIVTTLKYAEMLEGTVRQTGVHACGVIIGADDLTNYVPISTAIDKEVNEEVLVTQYEGSVIEEIGLIKMDFLGLKTLDVIKEVLSNIRKTKGIDIDIATIPIDDAKTYQLFSEGRTVGTFQFESAGMQKYLKELQPTQFEDLIAMNALYRPGPMQYIPQFINRKHGREQITYDFPIMEKRLKDTYGITVYQEQVMLLSRDLAGFTRGQSDELRKAMGKKLKDKMASLEVKFMEGAAKNGFAPKEKLEKIWNDWTEFAKYAFNKSHATCYSWIAYQTAYLKANYPSEFMAANLTRSRDSIVDVSKFMDECKSMGINVLSPDVNESDLNFNVTENGDIRFGLGGVKGVGEGAVLNIIEERKKNGRFKGIFDFVERINLSACNKKTIESLVYAGGFDGFTDIKREQFFVENAKGEIVIDSLTRYGSKYQEGASSSQNSLFGDLADAIEITKPEVPVTPDWSPLFRLGKERDYVGIFLSAHPLDEYEFELKYVCNTTTEDLKNLETLRGKSLRIGGIVTSVRNGTSKSGNPYGILTIEDYNGSHEFALFGKNYVDFGKYMIKDLYLYIKAVVQPKGADFQWKQRTETNEIELKINSINILNEVRYSLVQKLDISLPYQQITDDFAAELIDKVLQSQGTTNLYLNVFDEKSPARVTLFSRQHRVRIDKSMYRFLQRAKQSGVLEFAAT